MSSRNRMSPYADQTSVTRTSGVTRRSLLGGLAAAGALMAYDVRRADAATSHQCSVAVVGGGLGGVAAALALLREGRTVILTEPTSMLGGQLTSQMVPPDEHYWIEPTSDRPHGFGTTKTWQDLRRAVRESYRKHRPLTAAALSDPRLDPGNSWVSRLTAEPMVWRNRIDDWLAPYIASKKLRVWYGFRPVSSTVDSTGRITALRVHNDATSVYRWINATYYIDASELGDLLPVVGAQYTVGSEGNVNGELHRTSEEPDPADQQSFTWVAAVGYDRTGDRRTGEAPAGYASHKPAFDEFFATHLFDPTRDWPWTNDADGTMRDNPNFWEYRRVVSRKNFAVAVEEVTLLNYPCNDYKAGAIVNVSATERDHHLAQAKNLTACLVHYLQNDIPRQDGSGHGYYGIRLRPDIAGTSDGFAAHPYIREARRLVSLGRVWEWHIGKEARAGKATAAQFSDSVGTSHYWLDIHAGPKYPYGLWEECYTYQLPLMALIPGGDVVRPNLLVGGKAMGVSHVANGAYRLHITEWTAGEAAGAVAHLAIKWGMTPKQIRSSRMGQLRDKLRAKGFQPSWPAELRGKWQA